MKQLSQPVKLHCMQQKCKTSWSMWKKEGSGEGEKWLCSASHFVLPLISPPLDVLLLSHPPWNKFVNCSATKAAFPLHWLRKKCYCLRITGPLVTVLILARVEKSINRSCRSHYWPRASSGKTEAISIYWKIIYLHKLKENKSKQKKRILSQREEESNRLPAFSVCIEWWQERKGKELNWGWAGYCPRVPIVNWNLAFGMGNNKNIQHVKTNQ